MTADELIAFEAEVAEAFGRGEIRGPIHLSGGNEAQLIDVFKDIKPDDWVFSTWRNHYHALLHGVPREYVMAEIMAGRSMNLNSPAHRFFTSAIVGGTLPIAVGVAAGIKRRGGTERVWCFIGDMLASMGAYQDALHMSAALPIKFVVEDNGLSVNTPTAACWLGDGSDSYIESDSYTYERTYPHSGIDKWVQF